MAEINLNTTGLSGLLLLMDVRDFIVEKRERGWSDENILESILAVGRAAESAADTMLEELQTARMKKEDNP